MATEYVISDRSDGNDYAIKISDDEMFTEVSVSTPSSEPIFRDKVNTSNYWKLFFDDSEIAIESTVTAQDDSVQLTDGTNGTVYSLVVRDGELAFEAVTARGKKVIAVKAKVFYRTVKSDPKRRAVRYQRKMRAVSTTLKGGGVTINDGLYSITCLQDLYKILAMRY